MGDYDGRGWGMADGMGAGAWVMMGLLVVVSLVVVGLLVYLLARPPGQLPTGSGGVSRPVRSAAEETLDDRFARGEIDLSDYRERKAALHRT